MKTNKNLRKILAFVFIFLLMINDTAFGAISESIRFTNLTIEDGLSQSTVDKLYEDSRGYIWVGTNDGLNRYNGYEFKVYKNDKYDTNTIANNYIVDITEDKKGDMWISTTDGISRINTETDTIKNYNAEETSGNLSDNAICQILSTEENKIIAATEDGLNMYDEESDSFYRILEDELPSQYIYSVRQDSYGHIWIGTDTGVVEVNEELEIINTYEDSIGENEVYNTYDDGYGNIWVCTFGSGLFRINHEDNTVTNFKHIEGEDSLISDDVRDVLLGPGGKLWIVTKEGLCSYNYQTEKFTSYKKESYEKDSILDDKTRCILRDRSGLIWIGCYSGISVFNPNSSFHHFKSKGNNENSLSGNIIYAIYEDKDETLYIGTNENGLNVVDDGLMRYFSKDNGNLIGNAIYDITGKDNKVFVGTNDGLSVLTKNENDEFSIQNYTAEDGLPTNKIRSLYIDSKNFLWIGTNKGIAVLNISTGELTNISYIFDEMGVGDKFVRAIFEDSKGNYYIGCFLEGGLIRINPETKEYKIFKNDLNDDESISNDTVRYINEDKDGNILVGTSHGLNILDPSCDKFKHYTENDGLVNNTIYSILVDKNNDIWMSTNGGISRFTLADEKFKNFTIIDGLQSNEFNGRACFQSDDGYLFFGGINGFNVIDIDKIEFSPFQPKVIFDSFGVNGVKVKDVANRKFKSSENNIEISFFTNDYKNSKITKYYYRLAGLDDAWNVTNVNNINFANLSPGHYTLEVETVTQHGVESEISSVSFTIKPPFWKSGAAIFMYVIAIILVIIASINRVKTLDRLVKIRTIELREQMEENERLFNRVFMAEQSKNNYFVNLSHELRTPLNILISINQLIDSFSKNNQIITKEKLSYYMEVMNRNCTRLLNLINNLIDYAKIENNSYKINKVSVDIVYIVEETVLDMKDYIEEKGINLVFDTDVEEKLVECDKLDIERCIINLVNNAGKFTPEGGLIEVTITDLDSMVRISVKDNGIGISEENQKLIFDRFNQGKDNETESKGGSGLGLTITKQIIKLHGGDIKLRSELGSGSEFIITIPVK